MNLFLPLRRIHAAVAGGLLAFQLAGSAVDLQTIRIETGESGPMTACVLNTGGNRFFFMPPVTWSLKPLSSEGGVDFAGPDNSLISVRVVARDPQEAGAPSGDALRAVLSGKYPDCKFISQEVCYAEGGAGTSIDVEWETAKGAVFRTRASYLYMKGDLLEVSLTTTTNKFSTFVPSHFGVLMTVQPGVPGQGR